jgi:hypothetical protein
MRLEAWLSHLRFASLTKQQGDPDSNLVTVHLVDTGVECSEWRHEAHDGFSRRSKYRYTTSNSLRYSGTCPLVIFHGSQYLVASDVLCCVRQCLADSSLLQPCHTDLTTNRIYPWRAVNGLTSEDTGIV